MGWFPSKDQSCLFSLTPTFSVGRKVMCKGYFPSKWDYIKSSMIDHGLNIYPLLIMITARFNVNGCLPFWWSSWLHLLYYKSNAQLKWKSAERSNQAAHWKAKLLYNHSSILLVLFFWECIEKNYCVKCEIIGWNFWSWSVNSNKLSWGVNLSLGT